jgi:isocitrate dehydrogenase kinase/phosphatase
MAAPKTALLTGGRAQLIARAYEAYWRHFGEITRRARDRFEKRAWREMQEDARERQALYQRAVDDTLRALRREPVELQHDRQLWRQTKRVYRGLVAERDDTELAETFFNSITRRVFTTVGVDPEVEFIDWEYRAPEPRRGMAELYRSYPARMALEELVAQGLRDTGLAFCDLPGDARLIARELERQLPAADGGERLERIEMLSSLFFRIQFAYLVGRAWTRQRLVPLVIALVNPEGRGAVADAVLTAPQEIVSVFSLSRTYFLVETSCPRALVAFLQTLMPSKARSELFTAVGFKRHGKTELYRYLHLFLQRSGERFQIARGDRGLVMVVFTLPSFDLVFKAIRDRPGLPKDTSREEVIARYRFVFDHDRVGRLVDAQEFEHLSIERSQFDEGLLKELLEHAPSTFQVSGDSVDIRHIYVERRVTPLNLFVREQPEEKVREVIDDYGMAIKELAAANIFPGDVLLKNFGVKRDGRVIFYDYDELCLLSEIHFREMPASSGDEELSSEPWFYVGEHDVFPSEFERFLGLTGEHRALFKEAHGDLFGTEFWRRMQERHAAGELIQVFPYRRHLRRAGD